MISRNLYLLNVCLLLTACSRFFCHRLIHLEILPTKGTFVPCRDHIQSVIEQTDPFIKTLFVVLFLHSYFPRIFGPHENEPLNKKASMDALECLTTEVQEHDYK